MRDGTQTFHCSYRETEPTMAKPRWLSVLFTAVLALSPAVLAFEGHPVGFMLQDFVAAGTVLMMFAPANGW